MDQTKCTKCGQILEPGAQFCSACGSATAASPAGSTSRAADQSTWRRDGLIMAALALVIVVTYLAFREKPQAPHTQAAPLTSGHEAMPAEMLENLPTDYPSLVQMGNQFMDNENYPMAAELYRRALSIDSSSFDVRSDFASCLHAMGLPERALEEFRRIIATDNDHPIVLFNLGIVFKTL
jgi:tetratricopeptide (TPR) repeat protein